MVESVPIWLCAPEQQPEPSPPGGHAHEGLHGKTILLVLTGSVGRRRVLRKFMECGTNIICYNNEKNWAQMFIPSSQWVLGPVDDYEAALQTLTAWLDAQPAGRGLFQGVVCYDEYGIELASRFGSALGLPCNPPSIINTLRNKLMWRTACQRGGIPTPQFAPILGPLAPEDESRLHDAGVRFPAVVKPCACAGSYAVFQAHGMSDLNRAVQQYYDCLPAYLETMRLGPTSACAVSGMLVENLVQGHEVDIDCVVWRGVLMFACVSDNHPAASEAACNTFVERGGRYPSCLPAHKQEELLRMASEVVGLWGSQLSGVFHLEAFSTENGPVPIELNARIGGAETYTGVLAAWGVDLAYQALRIALGCVPVLPQLQTHHTGLMHLVGPVSNLGAPTHALTAHLAHLQLGSSVSCSDATQPLVGSSSRSCSSEDLSVTETCSNPPAALLDSSLSIPDTNSDAPHTDCLSDQLVNSKASQHEPAHAGHHVYHVGCDSVTFTALVGVHAELGSLCLSPRQPPVKSASGGGALLPAAPCPCGCTGDCGGPGEVVLGRGRSESGGGAGSPRRLRLVPGHDPGRILHVAPCCHAYSVNFVPDWYGEGLVEDVQVDVSTTHSPHYVDMQLNCAPGSLVCLPPLGFSALGWMVASGCDPAQAEAHMAELSQGVRIKLGPPTKAREQPTAPGAA